MSGAVDSVVGGLTGQDAADASKDAAKAAAAAEMAKLEYLKEIDKLPQAFRQGALTQLGANYGIGVDPETGEFTSIEPTAISQQQQIDQAMASPLYSYLMSGREAGEEALARRAAMGSGLRGGATTSSLIDYNTDLQNNALLSSFNQQQQEEANRLAGLRGLAMMPTGEQGIGQSMSNIGMIQSQGIQGAAQAKQNAMGNLMNVGGQLGAAYLLSDARLKDDIIRTGDTSHPYIFRYSWRWRSESGKSGIERGFIAQEIENVWPDLVETNSAGYKQIYKDKIEQRLKEIK